MIDRHEPVVFIQKKNMGESEPELGRFTVGVHVGSLLPALSGSSKYVYDQYEIHRLAYGALSQGQSVLDALPTNGSMEVKSCPDIGDELLRYGFLSRFHKPTPATPASDSSIRFFLSGNSPYCLMFTEKLERFKYWLARNDRLAEDIQWRNEEAIPFSSDSAI